MKVTLLKPSLVTSNIQPDEAGSEVEVSDVRGREMVAAGIAKEGHGLKLDLPKRGGMPKHPADSDDNPSTEPLSRREFVYSNPSGVDLGQHAEGAANVTREAASTNQPVPPLSEAGKIAAGRAPVEREQFKRFETDPVLGTSTGKVIESHAEPASVTARPAGQEAPASRTAGPEVSRGPAAAPAAAGTSKATGKSRK